MKTLDNIVGSKDLYYERRKWKYGMGKWQRITLWYGIETRNVIINLLFLTVDSRSNDISVAI